MFRLNIREKFIALMVIVLTISVVYMSLDYKKIEENTRKSLELEALNQALVLSKKISYFTDSIIYSYRKYDEDLRSALAVAQNYVKENGKDASLEPLKKELNKKFKEIHFDIYIINKDYVIENTTYKKDLGLDFHIIPEALKDVQRVYENAGSIDIAIPSLDSVTNEYKSYILQKAEEGDFLVQLSIVSELQYSMNQFKESMQKEAPTLFESTIYTIFPSSQSKYNIDYIWSKDYKVSKDTKKKDHVHTEDVYKRFVEDFDPEHKIEPKEMKKVLTTFVEQQDYKTNEIYRDGRHIFSVVIKYSTFSYFTSQRTSLLILKFDNTQMYETIEQQKIQFFAMAGILLLLFTFIMYLIDKGVMRPIVELHGLMREKKPVVLEKYAGHKDEIISMMKSYNKLLVDLQREIRSNELLLEEFKTFTANSIHQIRTPLSVIKIALESLDTQNEEALNQIKSSLVSIEHLYDSVSYTLAQEHVVFTKEKLSLSTILQERVEFFEVVALANDKKLVHKIRDGIEVFMNRVELEFLIDNNLSNALKYSPPFTEIEISLNKGLQEIILTFTNEGKLIEDTKVIFERHFRGDKSRKGNGLGLHIVDSICKRNHILIHVTSNGKINQFTYFFESDVTSI